MTNCVGVVAGTANAALSAATMQPTADVRRPIVGRRSHSAEHSGWRSTPTTRHTAARWRCCSGPGFLPGRPVRRRRRRVTPVCLREQVIRFAPQASLA